MIVFYNAGSSVNSDGIVDLSERRLSGYFPGFHTILYPIYVLEDLVYRYSWMSKLDSIKDAIKRNFSGENPPETMVANDAIQDGAAAEGNSDAQVNKGQQKKVSDKRDDCAECRKPWSTIKLRTPPLQCSFMWAVGMCWMHKKRPGYHNQRWYLLGMPELCTKQWKARQMNASANKTQDKHHITWWNYGQTRKQYWKEKAINTNVSHIIEICLETKNRRIRDSEHKHDQTLDWDAWWSSRFPSPGLRHTKRSANQTETDSIQCCQKCSMKSKEWGA